MSLSSQLSSPLAQELEKDSKRPRLLIPKSFDSKIKLVPEIQTASFFRQTSTRSQNTTQPQRVKSRLVRESCPKCPLSLSKNSSQIVKEQMAFFRLPSFRMAAEAPGLIHR